MTARRTRRRARFTLVLGMVISTTLFAAVAYADNLQSDLNTTTGGLDKTVNLGTLPGSSAQSQDVFLFVQETSGATNNPTYPFNVTGSGNLGATFSGVTISGAGTANGQTGQVSWTTPAPQATVQNYSIVVNFDANTTINESPATVTINFSIAGDSTPPVIVPTVSGTLGNSPWYVSNVAVSWSVTDAESAISSSSGCGPTTISVDTFATTLTCTATSSGGTSTQSVTVKRDATNPSIAGSVAPSSPDGANGWYVTAPTVTFTCSDDTSGVASCVAVGGSGASKTLGESASPQSVVGNTSDNAGNTNSATAGPFKVDLSDPFVSADLDPASPNGDNGWYRSDVELSWSVSDPQSDIGSASGCEVVNVTSDQAETTYTCNATNKAGRSNSFSVSVKRDATPPSIASSRSPAANGNGWNNSDVTVSFTCSDSLSGLSGACPAPVTLAAEGADQSVTRSVSDNAGNSASATESPVNIDKTDPSITATLSPAANAAGWNNTDVTVSYACADTLSGLDPIYGTDGFGCWLYDSASAEGLTSFVNRYIQDLAGNSDTVTTDVRIDKTPPSITSSRSPAANANGWNNSDVTVSFTCSDSLSGLSGACPAAVTVATEGAAQSVTRSVSDKAGNSASATEGPINIDKTAPLVSVAGVVNGGEYVLGSEPTPSCAASDALSGLAGPASLTVSGGSVNGVGTFVAMCSATDLAGNSAGAAMTYYVVYGGVSGILQPINPDGSSLFSRGRAVPVKFRLAGDEFFGFYTGSWLLQRVNVACDSSVEYSSEDVGSVTPATVFRYDSTADQYIYNADFRDKPTGSCWKVRVTLDSHQVLDSAKFRLAR